MAWWILVLSGWRAPFFDVLFNFVKGLYPGIRFSPPNPYPGIASSLDRARVKVCLRWISGIRLVLSLMDLVSVPVFARCRRIIHAFVHRRRLLFLCDGHVGCSTTTYLLSTTIRFLRLRRMSSYDSGAPSTRSDACNHR